MHDICNYVILISTWPGDILRKKIWKVS